MSQRTCINDSNPAAEDSVLCRGCLAGPGDTARLDFDGFAADPFGAPKGDVVPSEAQETFARELRAIYVALCRQGFTEREALAVVGHTVRGILGGAS